MIQCSKHFCIDLHYYLGIKRYYQTLSLRTFMKSGEDWNTDHAGSGISANGAHLPRGRKKRTIQFVGCAAPREYFWGPVAIFTTRKPCSKISSWPNVGSSELGSRVRVRETKKARARAQRGWQRSPRGRARRRGRDREAQGRGGRKRGVLKRD